MRLLFAFVHDENGTTAIEYCLIAMLISTAAIAAMGSLGSTIKNTFNGVAGNMASSSR